MKGHTGFRSKLGGTLKSKKVHGVSTAQHDNPHVMRLARASGGRVGKVEGGMASARLDRPGRKMPGAKMTMLNGNPGKAQSESDVKRVKTGEPKKDGADKYAKGGKVEAHMDDGWKKGDATEKPDGMKFASGGKIEGGGVKKEMIPKETNHGSDEGGWAKGDGTKHADSKAFKNGGKLTAKKGMR